MKLILVAAARPNFMKIAPALRAINKYNETSPNRLISPILIHTGQHYDYEMSQIFFNDLAIPEPDIHLGVGSGTHAEQTGKVMIAFEKILFQEKPDLVMVVGDVNSTLACALAAIKLHIPVAHVEAGMRSHDKSLPEEINRLLTDHISDYLFTTSAYDNTNLINEGIASTKIFCVGNIMADSLLFSREIAKKSQILSRLGFEGHGYALMTLHRPGNVDRKENFERIINNLIPIANRIPIIFPTHPRTQRNIANYGLNDLLDKTGIKLIEPLGYLDFLNLEMNSQFVITDSGGVQVETTVLGTPCLTILNSPIWNITHEQGTNILVGNDGQKILNEAMKIINSKSKIKSPLPKLWDGKTSERIVKILSDT